MEIIHKKLAENGIVYLRVPSFVSSWYFRLFRPLVVFFGSRFGSAKNFFKIPDGRECPPYHIHEYSPSHLKMLLKHSGFCVKKVYRFVPLPYALLDTKLFVDQFLFYGLFFLDRLSRVMGFLGMKTDMVGKKISILKTANCAHGLSPEYQTT